MKQLRQENPDLLLFDTGNCLAGRPLVDISNGEAMAGVMSAMGYDAMALGNTDFLHGWESIETIMGTTGFPILSANIVRNDHEPGHVFAKPYVIFERGIGESSGKIAVLGLSDPAEFGKVPRAKTGDLRVLDPVLSAAPVIKEILRETRRIMVLSNLRREQEIELANKYPDIDIIISARSSVLAFHPYFVTGDDVRDLESEGGNLENGTLIVSCIPKGQGLGVLDVAMSPEGDIDTYRFQLLGITLDTYEEDPEMLTLLRKYENKLTEVDATGAVEEYRELITGDFSHLNNVNSIKETGTRGLEAFEKGEYKEALELLNKAKSDLLIRETALDKLRMLEDDLSKGIPPGMPTDELYTELEKAKVLLGDRRYKMAEERFAYTNWLLSRIRTTKNKYKTYEMNKDILEEDGISLSMDEKTLENLDRDIQEERYKDALVTLRRVNMRITQGRDARNWRRLAASLFDLTGRTVPEDPRIASLRVTADSLYYAGSFLAMKQKYYRIIRMIEPLTEGKGFLSEVDGTEIPEGNTYVGSEGCRQCHEDEYEHWSSTLHSTAYTRMDEEAQNDADCAGCHVVGLGSESGFKIGEVSPGLGAVGCESCHGKGYLHSLNNETHTMRSGYERNSCRACHNPGKGFNFEYYQMLVKIMHP